MEFASRMLTRGISSTVLASTITERRYEHLFNRQRTDEQVREAMQSERRRGCFVRTMLPRIEIRPSCLGRRESVSARR
jgi:hypothetical protein